ncbi:L-alanine-DL-glutamate epimerase-like enolase superfamily enzyme [Hephaestia caeni]|uniref:L-alanine-DL-glutamate epimerase-like enolase superfamily enzyme n=1 Tax=Hephaestia caeni TaxID=645617 RepID=A0A397PE93_9SPHN|nr:enolase C-terminal domain-like protein [Hephaestia caeni]RIA45535.1 L-alanine-DL-glutamate epimerase-like enolase superfamily enzyme [Hephaestia caeni]
MKITEIVEQTVSIGSPIRNAVIDFSAMTVSAVAVRTDHVVEGRPLVGYGFSSNGRYAQGGILRERIIPRLLAADPDALVDASGVLDPFKCWDTMVRNEKPGGHGERSVAVGTIDMALWDLAAKAEGVPLYRLLADRYRGVVADPAVEVYAAGGYYYPGEQETKLQDELKSYLDMGFTAVKMKIGGAPLKDDLRRIEAALAVTGGGDALAVDANARFDVATALAYARAMRPYGLRWYEEPVEVLDFAGLAEVAAAASMPIATGENIFSMVDSRNLVRYGGLDPAQDYLQMDPALSYGLVEYLRTLDMLASHGWSARRCVPHGGHQFGLHLAAGLGLMGNEAYPKVFEPFGRFAPDMTLANGKVTLTDHPGIGYEAIDEIYRILSTETLS